MRSINSFIFEKLRLNNDINKNIKTKDKIFLSDEFIDDLDNVINDYEPNFKSEYSLDFLYNIFNSAMPDKAEVIHTAYDKNGKRIDDDMQMLSIKSKNNVFKISEDNYGQLKFTDNDKFIESWGLPKRKTEVDFGLNLITDVFNNDNCKNFKIDKYNIDIEDFIDIFGIDSSKKLKSKIIQYNIPFYDVYSGSIREDGNTSDSLSNNLSIEIIIPNSKNFKPYFYVDGAGLYGSKKRYKGDNKSDFVEMINTLIKEHL